MDKSHLRLAVMKMVELGFWNLRRKKYRGMRGDECCWGRIRGGCGVRRRFGGEFCAVEGGLEVVWLMVVLLLLLYKFCHRARLLLVLGDRAAD